MLRAGDLGAATRMLRIFEIQSLNNRISTHSNLTAVMLDQLRVIDADAVHLPMPRDSRAKRIAALLQASPSIGKSLSELARIGGASKRTLERIFKGETGMGFGKWRQQLRLGHALRLLASGQAVTSVALEVGYDSASAFISAFRMTFGQTPGQYFRAA